MAKDIIAYLKSNMANLSSLILDASNFKTKLIESLQKIGAADSDFKTIDIDNVADNSIDIEELSSSVMKAIQQYSNFNGDNYSSDLFSNLSSSYWNESVSDAIANFQSLIPESLSPQDFLGNSYVTYDELVTANAGYTFVDNSIIPNSLQQTEWVRPSLNMYQSKYGQVRTEGEITGDAVLTVLRRISNLNFTHTQEQPADWSEIKKNIRLIMPKNSHRVEIEDLNRNFWVITQTIAAISGFLFGDIKKSPLGELEFLLDEMLQLWDNILWLWILLLASAVEDNAVHVELITIDDSTTTYIRSDERHFDDFVFSSANLTARVDDTLNQIAEKYPNKNLVILLQQRKDNYMWNYYRVESYPFLCVKGRNWSNWKKLSLSANIPADNQIFSAATNNKELDFSISDFFGANLSPKIGQIKDNGRRQAFSYPATSSAAKGGRWFSALRIVPHVEATTDSENPDIIKINKVAFSVYDVASQGQVLVNGKDLYKQAIYSLSSSPLSLSSSTTNNRITLTGKIGEIPKLQKYNSIIDYYEKNNESYYLGELVSEFLPYDGQDGIPFGEWFHIRPLQDSDNSSPVSLTGNNLFNTGAATKIYSGELSQGNAIKNIGLDYVKDQYNKGLTLVVLSRAYQNSEIEQNLDYNYDYDFYNANTKKFETHNETLSCAGDQILGIFCSVNQVGSVAYLNTTDNSIYQNSDFKSGAAGNIVHYPNLICKSEQKSIMWFPHSIEYFGNVEPKNRASNTDWFVKITAIAAQEADAGQVSQVVSNFCVKKYNDRYVVLTEKIIIYAIPIANDNNKVSAVNYYMIQKDFPLTFSGNNIKKIGGNTRYYWGGTHADTLNNFIKKNNKSEFETSEFNITKQNSFVHHRIKYYGNGQLVDLFEKI